MKTTERMGIPTNDPGYGARVNAALMALHRLDLNRDERLALAWALVDQSSSHRTSREAQEAMSSIEYMYEAEAPDEDACPPTLPRISVAP